MIYFVDARTKFSGLRLSGISDDIEELVMFFRDWADRHELSPNSIWYADVFSITERKRIGTFELLDDRNVLIDTENIEPTVNHWKRFWRRFK